MHICQTVNWNTPKLWDMGIFGQISYEFSDISPLHGHN